MRTLVIGAIIAMINEAVHYCNIEIEESRH